jgi:hypothetical protein
LAEVDSGALSSLEQSMESSLEQSMESSLEQSMESSMEHHGDSVMGIVVGTLLTATTLVVLSVLGEWIINHRFSCFIIRELTQPLWQVGIALGSLLKLLLFSHPAQLGSIH